jgi:prephenate dehydratase
VAGSVVPIENSVEGGVSATLDYLAAPGEQTPLQIVRETVIKVAFDLAARPDTTRDGIQTVLSHPHAVAQCRAWLADNLPHATIAERGSTAAAAQEVAQGLGDAAICAPVATKLYGLVPLESNIADNDDAVTRFVLVARAAPGATPAATGRDKTTLVAYIRSDHSGALLEILEQLAVRGVNLTRIESRPTKTTLGSYCFSMDAEGHIADARVAEALAGLKRICADVEVLGSDPRADGQPPQVPYGGADADYAAAAEWLAGLRR